MANEKRLIDAEVVRHKINAFASSVVYRGNAEMFNGKDSCNPHEYTRGYERGILDAQKIVSGQPTVDAVEVVHGRWIHHYHDSGEPMDDKWYCSECHMCNNHRRTWYCPHCGAKMDGDGNG